MAAKNRRSNNIKIKVICEQCKMQVKEEEENFINCDKCAKKFHSQCTKLDERQFEYLLNNESEIFTCHICEGGCDGGVKN